MLTLSSNSQAKIEYISPTARENYTPTTMFPEVLASLGVEPYEPPYYLLAGYVISGVTAAKLTFKIQNLDPEKPPYADFLSPPSGTQISGNNTLIKAAIKEYLITNGWKPSEAVVDIVFTGTEEETKTIIVTQSCLLPDGFEGSWPGVKMGKRERCVCQWLEQNGTLLLATLLTYSHVILTGVDENQYKWGVRKEQCDWV